MALQLKLDPTNLEAGARRAEAALQGVKGEAVQVETAIEAMARSGAQEVNQLAANTRQLQGAASGAGFAVQNAAFQIGDFATQVAGGVPATRALAQQLPQLLGGFGVMGAVIGGAVAVLGVLVPLLWDSVDAAAEAAKANEAYGDSFDGLKSQYSAAKTLHNEYVEAVKSGNKELIAAIELEAQARQAQFNLARIDMEQTAKAAKEALDAQTAIVAELSARRSQAFGDMVEAQRTFDEAMADGGEYALEALSALEAQRDTLRQVSDELAAAQGPLERTSAEWAVIDAQVQVLNEKIEANGDLIEIVKNGLGDSTSAAGELAAAGNAAAAAFQGLAGWAAMANANIAAAAANAQAIRAGAAAGLAGSLPGMAGPAGMGSAPPSGGAVLTSPRPGQRSVDSATFGGGAAGGGAAGGGAAAEDARAAYDRLLASLDPVVAKSQQMAKAQETVNAAFAAGDITAAEHANALDLIATKYGETANAMTAMQDAGTNALDALIERGASLGDVMKQLARDILMATAKAELLKHVTGGNSGMSIGGLLMQGIFSGFHDSGGKIGVGQVGMVGERGPELVRATTSGAIVTSRVDTARMMQPQNVRVDVAVTVDDEGKIKAMVRQAGQSSTAQAVETVRRSLAGWSNQLATDGALA